MIIVIDGNNTAWRAAHVGRGTEWGLEFGFLRIILKLVRQLASSTVFVVWDSKCQWRYDLYPDYKGSKIRMKYDPFKLITLNKITSLQTIMSWVMPQYICEGCEADDVISALSSLAAPQEVFVVSTDRDMHQLISDRVTVLSPKDGKYQYLTPYEIKRIWDLNSCQDLRWLRAYAGDTSDHIPGCRVPKKYLAQILNETPTANESLVDDQRGIEMTAQKELTKGWLKRLLGFHNTAIRNYHLMSLIPPKIGSFIRCDYNPDFGRFMNWLRAADLESMQAQVIAYFGSPRSRSSLEQPQIANPWPSYSEELERILPLPGMRGGS